MRTRRPQYQVIARSGHSEPQNVSVNRSLQIVPSNNHNNNNMQFFHNSNAFPTILPKSAQKKTVMVEYL